MVWDALEKNRFVVLAAGRRFGKALALDTDILTTVGYKKLIDIKVDDYIFGDDGKPTKVIYRSFIYHNRNCYKITFSDNSTIIADEQHDWVVETKSERKNSKRRKGKELTPKKLTTKQIYDTYSIKRKDGKNESNYSIPITGVEFTSQNLPLEPYFLGLWLGDGSSRSVNITNTEPEVIEYLRNLAIKKNYRFKVISQKNKVNSYAIVNERNKENLQSELRKLNLLQNKHIPSNYLINSRENRLELLKGLIDSDGYVDSDGYCEYSTIREELAEDVFKLLVSLGFKPTLKESDSKLYSKICGKRYRIHFTTTEVIAKVKRKQFVNTKEKSDLYRRFIKKVEKIDSVPVRCLAVDNESHLFLAGKSLIATHNTILAVITLLMNALSHEDSLFWFVSPSYRQSKMIAWRMLKSYASLFDPKFNESELSVTFPNGSTIELKGADNEDALRGTGIWGMVIDEFATIYNNWSVWHEVLRPALTDKKGWTLFISTPKGKDAFFELYLKGKRNEHGYASFQYKTIDNPYIDDNEVREAKRTMPERYFKQEYEASFEDYIGLIWSEFTKDHIIEPYYLQKAFNRIGAIDPAVTGTTGVLKTATDDDGNIIVYDEYYEKDKRVSEVSEAIKEESDIYWLIDRASKAKNSVREGELYSLYDEYRDNGIVAYPGESDVEAGINRVGELFKQNKIKIFNTCKNLIWELERYHWAELRESIKGIVKPVPYHANSHLCDALRWIAMSRTDKADMTLNEPLSHISPQYKMEQLKKRREAFK